MANKIAGLVTLLLLVVPAALGQTGAPPRAVRNVARSAQAANSGQQGVACRVMEVIDAERLGVRAAIFHQRDKADGPRLGELLQAHTGQDMEFETSDGKRHGALVVRIKSCFGRGLLLFAASEAKLAEKEDFILRFPSK